MDSTATVAGPESHRKWQLSAPPTAMRQPGRQPYRLSARDLGSAGLWYVLPGFGDSFIIWWNKSLYYYTHKIRVHTCASSLAYTCSTHMHPLYTQCRYMLITSVNITTSRLWIHVSFPVHGGNNLLNTPFDDWYIIYTNISYHSDFAWEDITAMYSQVLL